MSSDPATSPEPIESAESAESARKPESKSASTPAKPAAKQQPESAVKFTRTAALWTALILGFVILILLLVFVLQNGDDVTLRMFTWQLTMQKGVAILLSAIGGGLVTFAVASVRLMQLRLAARKNLKAGL